MRCLLVIRRLTICLSGRAPDIWLYVCLSKPIEILVSVSFTHYCASTPDLSTWWSSTALSETWF